MHSHSKIRGRNSQKRNRWNRNPRIEPLETRDLLSITVTTLVDENNGVGMGAGTSLREAIAAAAPGDTINFSVTGQITLTLGQLNINKALTISGPGASLLTIDASGNDPTPHVANQDGIRIFNITAPTSGTPTPLVSISGLTMTGGDPSFVSGSFGGGAILSQSNIALTNCVLENNSAVSGGALYQSGTGNVTITHSVISGNNSVGNTNGGGLYFSSSGSAAINIASSVVTGNTGGFSGGGIYARLDGSSSILIEQCQITANSAAGTFRRSDGGVLI